MLARHRATDPAQLLDRLQSEVDAANDILRRSEQHRFGDARYPTPMEVSQAGRRPGEQGPDATWIGKRALLGSEWSGEKNLARPGVDARPDRNRADAGGHVRPAGEDPPSGERHAATPIPGTRFVADGRSPGEAGVLLTDLHATTLDVRSEDFGDRSVAGVGLEAGLVRVDLTDGSAHRFELAIGHGMRNVAETVVRAGTIDDPHLIWVNSRVLSSVLPRVWVHEFTETIARHQALTHGPRPADVVRRAQAADPRMRLPGDPERSPEHVQARLNERRMLIREYRAGFEARRRMLADELAGLDRDLRRLGYPVDRLSRVPGLHSRRVGGVEYGHEPEPPLDRSRHDEIWSDPEWTREGRAPHVGELVPRSEEEVSAWEPRIQAAFADHFAGREFAGLRVQLKPDRPVRVMADHVTVRADIVHPQRGVVGEIYRAFSRDADGKVYASHGKLRIEDSSLRGHGFARRFNGWLEDWYRDSGVDRIELQAVEVGGYAWARAGYNWSPEESFGPNAVLARLRVEARQANEDAGALRRWLAGDDSVDTQLILARHNAGDPRTLASWLETQYQSAQSILEQARTHPFGSSGYPTPFEVSQVGWRPGLRGPNATWVGKRALLGADWQGVKKIEPRHAASPIEGTEFVPDSRWPSVPDLSVGEMHRAAELVRPEDFADGRVDEVASEHALIRVDLADGRTEWFDPQVGRDMTNVAETAVRAGTRDDPHPVWMNARVAPEHVPRAWVHEITETLAIRSPGPRGGRQGAHPGGLIARLTQRVAGSFGRTAPEADPHVQARLNERLFLQRELNDATRPAAQDQIRREIDGLDRDLANLGYPVERLPRVTPPASPSSTTTSTTRPGRA